MALVVPSSWCPCLLLPGCNLIPPTPKSVASKWGSAVKADTQGRPLLFYCELRVVRADDLWLSQNTTDAGGDTLALAFGMNKADPARVMAAARDMEAALNGAGLKPKPHWAKLHAMAPAHVASLYGDAVPRFRELRGRVDPACKFSNAWTRSYGL